MKAYTTPSSKAAFTLCFGDKVKKKFKRIFGKSMRQHSKKLCNETIE